MTRIYDTRDDTRSGAPLWFAALAWLLPAGIFVQFVSAGFGLFLDANLLGLHAGIGIGLSLPVLALAAAAVMVPRLRGFGRWAGLVLLLYAVQVALAAGAAPLPLSLHPANGALLLAASLALLGRVERSRGAASARQPAA